MQLSRRQSLLANLGLLLAGLVCSCGGLEAAAWFWERQQAQGPYAWELVASQRIKLDRFETPGAGYTLAHPGEAYNWQGIPVLINSQGLRGPEVSLGKPRDTYRILNLGDSVAFGWGVRYQDTYGCQLQQMLNLRYGQDPQRYEVVNAGAPGWNMENARAFLQARGLAYQPDLILLNLTVVNDVYGGSAVDDSGQSFFDWLRDHTYLWPLLSVQRHLLLARMGQQQAIPILNPPSDAASYFPVQENDPRWDAVWKPIRAMAALAAEHNSQFMLLVLPTAFQVKDTTYPDTPQRVLSRLAGEAGIEILDLLPAFRQACQTAPAGPSCGPESRYLWADMWMHPSALGHRLMANSILNVLDERQWH